MVYTYVAYLRVSTNRQGESGLGVEAQREAISRYVAGSKGQLLAEFVEVESGSARDRPVLAEALNACRTSKAVLLIAKLDRLARNVAFVSALMESGAEFVAVDAPYANRLMIHILAAFAEHERTQISERTKAALAAAKARGVKLGQHAAVLAVENRRLAVEWGEMLRPQLVEITANRSMTLQQIADELEHRGIPTREEGRWHPMTVSRVLVRLGLSLAQSPMSAAT